MNTVPEPSAEHLNILRKYFGHNQFRPMQWKIIHSLLEKKQDNCVVMATGYGKSLCYQYPAVYRKGLSIVISPLISLMQDQVLSLQMSNIPACYFGSAQSSRRKSLEDVLRGECRVLYITPEWFISGDNRELIFKINEAVNITLIAIDEAHCVSQWGHDFRTSYRQLGGIRKIISEIPILAVTASATPQVKLDICRSLSLKNAQVICTGFDRPNLYFAVSMKTNDLFEDLKKLMVKGKGFACKFPGPTIIYCPTKKMTEKIAEELNSRGIKCAPYHADLPLNTRQAVHQEFVKGQLPVVVATVAFGMGIDKPDVRFVIHYGAPKEIESYYQEVGRAGRDGLPSTCHVFYANADFSLQRYFTNIGSTDANIRQHRERMARLMQKYLETRDCRRQLLLSYFDDNTANKPKTLNPNCCDNCAREHRTGKTSADWPKVDVVNEIKLLLRVMELFNGRFGLGVPIKFIRGLKDPKLNDALLKNPLYGSGKANSEAAWKALGRLCLREGLLKEVVCGTGFGAKRPAFVVSTVAITSSGKKFITEGESDGFKLLPSAEVEVLFRKKQKLLVEVDRPGSSSSNRNNQLGSKDGRDGNKEREQQAALFGILKRLRDQLALAHNCSPHIVASEITLHKIAVQKPSTLSDLANIGEFNEAKLQKFGNQIIQTVREFCGKTNDPNSADKVQFEDTDDFDDINPEYFNHIPDYNNTQVSINQYQAEDDVNSMDFEFSADFASTSDNPPNMDEFYNSTPTTSTRTNPTNYSNSYSKYSTNDDDDLTDFEDDSSATVPTTCANDRVEFPSNDDDDFDIADIEPSPHTTQSTEPPKVEVKKLNDDYWGSISDQLFESVPLDNLSQPTSSVPAPQQRPAAPNQTSTSPPSVKKVKFNPKIQYDTDSDDDLDKAAAYTAPKSTPTNNFDSNKYASCSSHKMEMPDWLTKPTAKLEIRKRVKSNSLFKI